MADKDTAQELTEASDEPKQDTSTVSDEQSLPEVKDEETKGKITKIFS